MERERFEIVWNEKAAQRREEISFLNFAQAEKAQLFHSGFSVYQKTPLVSLDSLAQMLQVKSIQIKDESKRFGLHAFKVLGASYAIANEIARRLG